MTKEQIDALIEYIQQCAQYEARIVTDDETDHGPMYAAEKQLRSALSAGDTNGT